MTSLDAWDYALARLFPKPHPQANDPIGWVRERLRGFLWSKQQEIMRSVREHRRTAVRSCHGPGKTKTAARVVCHHVDTQPDPGVVTTAPSDYQVRTLLWDEIMKEHKAGGLAGRITEDAKWKIDGQLVAFGRKPPDPKKTDPKKTDAGEESIVFFQGKHAGRLLVVFDEADGIVKPLWNAATTLLTGSEGRMLAIGNPDNPNSEFARVCRGAPAEGGMSDLGWNVVQISLFDTPNFTGEPIPEDLREHLPSQVWLDEFIVNVGPPGSSIYTSKVLGQFPQDRGDGVIPWSWLSMCRGYEAVERVGALMVPRELGVDVGASDNGDWTVVRAREGNHAGRSWRVQSKDPEVVAATVVGAAREVKATRIKIDAIGVGWSLVALVRRDLPGVRVDAVDVSTAAPDGPNGEKYNNLRSKIWWEVGRIKSQQQAWDVTGLDERTIADLTEPRWWEDPKTGRIVIESKDDVRPRLGRSPDDGDATLLAFYEPPELGPRRVQVVDERLGGRRSR